MENDSSRWLRIRRLVARNVCPTGKQAKVNLERIVYNQVPRSVTHTAPVQQVSKEDCLPKNATIQTHQTICRERNGDAVVRKACVRVVLGIYLI